VQELRHVKAVGGKASEFHSTSSRHIGGITKKHAQRRFFNTAVGPGLLESAYFGCLCYELASAGLRTETLKALPLVYCGVRIDCSYRADLVVESLVIVEVKALEALAPIHSRQLLTYLRVADCPLGLLLDFGQKTMKEGIKRVINGYHAT
jgi:GxxExxY protein